jgi:hypothetical protein
MTSERIRLALTLMAGVFAKTNNPRPLDSLTTDGFLAEQLKRTKLRRVTLAPEVDTL